MIVKNPKKEHCVFCGTHDGVVKRKCRCKTDRLVIKGEELKKLDELVLGDGWLHLERTHGVNNREWCLIITDEKGRKLNITIHDVKDKIKYTYVYENEWEGPEPTQLSNEWGVK